MNLPAFHDISTKIKDDRNRLTNKQILSEPLRSEVLTDKTNLAANQANFTATRNTLILQNMALELDKINKKLNQLV